MTLAYQTDFIDICLRLSVLRFGKFTLKSGRESPYFFNAGLLSTGLGISAAGRAYAAALAQWKYRGLQRGTRITTSDLVVEAGGHLRAYRGRAYLPALIPAGMTVVDLHVPTI